MRTNTLNNTFRNWLAAVTLIACSSTCFGGALSPMVDDFSDANTNSYGIARMYMNDTMAGGSTTTDQGAANGILSVSGELVPPRGQPGWASAILPLDAQGLPKDASSFAGIRLLVKVDSGNLTISANSTEVTNFDYHAAPVFVKADGKFHEVKIPFTSMQRSWSEKTPLNPETLASLSITAYSLQKDSFAFEVDEVSFYKN